MEMPHQQERNSSALDELEHSLYDPKKKMEDVTLHHTRGGKTLELPSSWGDDTPIITQGKEEHGVSFGMKLLVGSLLLLVVALAFTAWRIVSLRNVVSSANIDMSIEMTPYTEGGEEVPLTFVMLNRNKAPLQDAKVTLIYKQGVGAQDEQEKVHEVRDLGVVNPNENKRQDFTVVLYGSEAEKRDLTLKLEYKVAGSNAVFNKVVDTSTVLKTPPIAVHIDGPKILSVGQNGTFTITVKNNSATTSLPSVLQLTLPNTFTMASQEPRSKSKTASWNIPPIPSGKTSSVTINGSLEGTQGEVVSMKAIVGGEGENKSSVGIVYSAQTFDIKLRTSPLTFSVALDTDGGTTEKLRYGDNAVLTIGYVNASEIPLHDVVVKLTISGDAPLIRKIDPTNGYYDSEKQTITWDAAGISDLALLAPGANGTFRVIVPIVVAGANSPSLKINVTGSATSQQKNDVIATITRAWSVEGSATVHAETKYKDSQLKNSGPIPPMPNQDTTYTARIIVSAQNALTNGRVSFNLPTYVSWKGVTSDDANVSFDPKLRTVTWSIGNLAAEKTAGLDVTLSVRPSLSHVGRMPSITSGIVFDADEEVSKAHIRTTTSALTTFISGESWMVDPSRVVDR